MIFKNYKQIISNGQNSKLKKKRKDVLEILNAAIDSVDPFNCVKNIFKKEKIIFKSKEINLLDFNNIYVVGFGKASVGMANAVCNSCSVKYGVVITNDSNASVKNDSFDVFVGGHPIPNQNSILGAEKILEVVNNCKEDDLLLVLISGGGSSLLSKPKVSLKDLQKTTDLLLRSGADIKEINTIRKHLSDVKGGQLIKNVACRVISLVISDIVDDPLEFIASGPTYPDSTTFNDAKNILLKYNLFKKIPYDVRSIIQDGVSGKISDTPSLNNNIFNKVSHFIVANNKIACDAALHKAGRLGYESFIHTTSLTGEARFIGKFLVDIALNYKTQNEKDVALISGGETTVKIRGNGKGGRNQELVLGVISSIEDQNVVVASFATDGIDGSSDAAGAIADLFTSLRAEALNLKADDFLKDNNSYEFFNLLNDLFITGSTGTNVMDIQLILI